MLKNRTALAEWRAELGKGILERLADGPVLGDGGYIVELEQRGHVITGAFTPEVALTHPEAVRELHYEMKNAGCEVLQVMAFYGSREKLATVGFADRTLEINRAATCLAREVAGSDLLVAGDLSATWKWKADDADAGKLVTSMFDEQIEAQEGVDFFIGETFFHLGEALLCLDRTRALAGVPAMITLSFRAGNATEDGFTAAEAAKRLHGAGADIVGVNCMNDPGHMYPTHRGDAGRLRRTPGGAAGGVPVHRRDPLVHRPAVVPRQARAHAAHTARAGRVRHPRQGDGRQLHRWLLWLQGNSHEGDGQGAWQAARDVAVGGQARVADERDRAQLGASTASEQLEIRRLRCLNVGTHTRRLQGEPRPNSCGGFTGNDRDLRGGAAIYWAKPRACLVEDPDSSGSPPKGRPVGPTMIPS